MIVKTVSLGEVAEFVNGYSFKPSDWNGKGKRIIRIQNLTNQNSEYNKTTTEVNEKYFVYPGDLLVSWSASLGVYEWNNDDTALLNQHIFKVNPNYEIINKNYFRYVLNQLISSLEKYLRGSTMMHINRQDFLDLKFPLPRIDEQKRIADILDKADAIRRKRQEAIKLSEDFLRSVFLDMFGNPVKNIKSWGIKSFCDVCESRLGKMLDSKSQTGKSKKPYLRNANVLWDHISVDNLFEMDFSEKDKSEFILKKGDVLICEGGDVGRAAIWQDDLKECYFQKALHRARPLRNEVTSEYLVILLWFYSKYGGFKDFTTSVTIAHLTGIKLKEMKIPVPPIALQKKFSDIYYSNKCMVNKFKASEKYKVDLFNSLIQKAFRGEL